MNLDDLIIEAEKIKTGRWNSPLKNLYSTKVFKYVSKNYGEDYGRVIRNALSTGVVRSGQESWNQSHHEEKMQGVIEVLEQLKNEESHQPEPSPTPPRTVASGNSNVNYHVYGGTVQVGDGNQVNNITVRDIITELESEISKLPDSTEKEEAITGLKTLTRNETFANITGAALGSFLSSLLK